MAQSFKSIRSEKITTPEFRVSFPQVFQPKAMKEGDKEKYSVVMLFDKAADRTQMKQIVASLCKDMGWDPKTDKKYASPFIDGNIKYEEKPELYGGYKDTIVVNAKGLSKPGLIDGRKNIIIEPNEFYAGCYARASVTAFTWEYMGKHGVAFGLQNLQKLRDGEHFSGRSAPQDDFDAVDAADDDMPSNSADDFEL